MTRDSVVNWNQVATTGSAQKLLGPNGGRMSLLVMAHPDNTGRVYVGFDNTVANDGSKGFPLSAGVTFSDSAEPAYSGEIWINAQGTAQKVIFSEVG